MNHDAQSSDSAIPNALRSYFADSWLNVERFSADDNLLVIRIEKEIGPETGEISFRGVSFLSMPVSTPGESIRSRPLPDRSSDFWFQYRLDPREFEPDDVVFEIHSQDGPTYVVIAKSIGYEVLSPG